MTVCRIVFLTLLLAVSTQANSQNTAFRALRSSPYTLLDRGIEKLDDLFNEIASKPEITTIVPTNLPMRLGGAHVSYDESSDRIEMRFTEMFLSVEVTEGRCKQVRDIFLTKLGAKNSSGIKPQDSAALLLFTLFQRPGAEQGSFNKMMGLTLAESTFLTVRLGNDKRTVTCTGTLYEYEPSVRKEGKW